MKKTLIAVAALAATGAFAQVTISGKLGLSIQKTHSVATTLGSQGMRVTDGDVNFKASEDLGGGYAASTTQAIKVRGRDTAVAGRDSIIALTTPFGTVAGGNVEAGPMHTNAWAGAQASFANGPDDGIIFDGYGALDFLSFTMPISPALSASVLMFEAGAYDEGSLSQTAAQKLTGTVTSVLGTNGNPSGVSGQQIAVAYAAGPIALNADYTAFVASRAISDLNDGLTRVRVAGTYDFGVAKAGIGFQTKSKGVATQYAFGVNVPVGAVEFGLTYSARMAQTLVSSDFNAAVLVAAADARSATTLGMKYNLSKTANLSINYASYTGVGSVNGSAATSDNEYRIRLLKSF